jgi:hypothetical protein
MAFEMRADRARQRCGSEFIGVFRVGYQVIVYAGCTLPLPARLDRKAPMPEAHQARLAVNPLRERMGAVAAEGGIPDHAGQVT